MAGQLLRLVAGVLLLASTPAWAEGAARVSFVEGTAQRSSAGQTSALKIEDELSAGDTVRTAAKSRLELLLADGSVVRVGPDSQLELSELAYVPDHDTISARFHLLLGSVWAKVNKLGDGGKFEVSTERAVAGVRGTEFRVDAAGEAGGVEVYEGKVHVLDNAIAMREVPMGNERMAMVKPQPAPQAEERAAAPAAPAATRAAQNADAKARQPAGMASDDLHFGGEPSAPAQKEFDVTPGQRLRLEGKSAARLENGQRKDELASFFRTRELPRRERFFKERERRDKAPNHERDKKPRRRD